ncbi:MAG: TatD family hydrolase [Gammaproteobacteria bacterium]|nr:TatD family hydrolase [Gammaproteobacteria bacterium]
MKLIDSHCHLDDDRYDCCRDSVVLRARQQGVEQIILPATTAYRWQKVKQIAEKYEQTYPVYGLHPMFMSQHQLRHLQQLDAWIDSENPIAVGECGLDFFQSREDEDRQLEFFKAQLGMASNYRLPVIVHVRKAMDQVISLLRKAKLESAGVIHSFAGSLQQAQQLFELGFKIGIAATVDFERARKLRTVVAKIDSSALLLESDAPDQPGINHRGKLNEPAFIVEHFRTIAQLRDISEERLSNILNSNTKALFSQIVQSQGRT